MWGSAPGFYGWWSPTVGLASRQPSSASAAQSSALPWHCISLQHLLLCSWCKLRSVLAPLQAGCCSPLPMAACTQLCHRHAQYAGMLRCFSWTGDKCFSWLIWRGSDYFFAKKKEVEQGSCTKALKWLDLCSISLRGANEAWDDLILKTCWTCW